MKDLSDLRIILTEIPDELFGSLGPILARGNLTIERVPRAIKALEKIIAEPYDTVITSHPLVSVSMRNFLLGIRRPPSVSRTAKILVAVASEQRGELAPFLVERGIDELISPDEDPLLVQHAVSNILGVAPRAAIRVVLRLQALVGGSEDGEPLLCTSVDLSSSGALIESSALLEVGTHVALRLFVPGGREPLEVQARVVRHADPRFDRTEGFAVRFLDLDGPKLDALRVFIEAESTD